MTNRVRETIFREIDLNEFGGPGQKKRMEEYREIVKLGPVYLCRSDLHDLESVLLKDLTPRPDSNDFRIRLGDGARTVTANSMSQLFQSSLPKRTNDLSVEITSWNDRNDIDGGVHIVLYKSVASYQIHAKSETLFLGKKTQLNEFFLAHRPWYTLVNRFLPMVGPSVLISALFSAAFLAEQGRVVAASLSGTLSVVSLAVVWLALTQKVFPHVRVQLSEPPIIRRSAFELITLLVQFLLLIATIISILFPLFMKSS